jgi:hypothetical protein
MRIHPCFEMPAANQPILLGSETGTVLLRGELLEGKITVYVKDVPRPRVLFGVEVPGYFGLDLSRELEVTLTATGVTVPCQVLRGGMFSELPSTIWVRPLREIVQGAPESPVSKVVFGIPNFPDFIAHGIVRPLPGGGWRREDEIKLQFSDWNVTIESIADIDERSEVLSDAGGFGITAIGVMERSDRQPFVWDVAAPHIEALRVFLSFACGRWTGPTLPAGLDSNGARVWFRWSLPLIDEGFHVFTWFDAHRGMTLSDIVPIFMTKWSDPQWRQALSYAIYWFVRANSAGAGSDGSLILSQAALEILSWTYLVRCAGMSRSAFKSLKATGAIREILTRMGIPPDIPTSLTALQTLSKGSALTDGVGAIVYIRNALVHPEKGNAALPVTEAWVLAQRFIELIILKLCEFNGEHANRTVSPRWIGQVERVPWA